ncbi:GspH/FimT family pseudopilin [Stenotrophomonas sp.]|uniref:GspH/FimT family protein n=1 Tax=Stenotrophomonas sp. TaxID=69392 RepID=UPI002FC9D42E
MPSPTRFAPRRRPAGWSLVECLVAVLVLGVLCAVALPDARALLDRQRAANARHLLSTDLAFARLAAIQRHAEVSVCASVEGRHCAGVDAWGSGWMVYEAPAGSSAPPAADGVLRHQAWRAPPGWRIVGNRGRSRLRYRPDGRAYGTNLSLWICRHDHLYGRVVINNTGRVRSEVHDAPGGCIR